MLVEGRALAQMGRDAESKAAFDAARAMLEERLAADDAAASVDVVDEARNRPRRQEERNGS